ncbi:MAG TPA: hypothetical protein VN802_01885 [Stellaceae bacterium]|nr:hypothetical protein [Stellaceae bacterium]
MSAYGYSASNFGVTYREEKPMAEMVGLQDSMNSLGAAFYEIVRKYKVSPRLLADSLCERYGLGPPRHNGRSR